MSEDREEREERERGREQEGEGEGEGREAARHNVISGEAALTGVTVQAGQVYGGIHAHLPAAATPVPRQLPPVSRLFTDREGDLRALEAARDRRAGSASPLIVVTGPAGIGKTTVATHWLRQLTDAYPGGQFYVDLRGHTLDSAVRPGEVLGQFLRAMGAPAATGLAEQAALWRSMTAQLRIAVLLDNASTAAQVRSLLPGGEGSLVVVTCRQRLTGLGIEGADFHELGSLPPKAATELLCRGVGAERITRDAAAAKRVVDLCAGLPLALCLVSARLAARPGQPVRAMAEALSSDRRRLTVLEVKGERAVRGVLDESYAALSGPAAELYRGLGLLPVLTFDRWLAAAVCQVTPAEAETRLDALVEANLLEDHGEAGYRFHDLVRLHAGERAYAAQSRADRAATVRRAFDVRLAAVAEAERLLVPARQPMARDHATPLARVQRFDDAPAALAWLAAQRPDLMSLLREAATRGWHEAAWQLTDAMWPLFLRLRHHEDWIAAHRIGLDAARRAHDRAAERQMLTSGAAGLSSAGQLDEAAEWYDQARESARRDGARRPYGQALLGLGACKFELGRGAEGVPYLREAIEVWEGIGYVRGAALARIVLGEIALERSAPQEAVGHFAHAHRALGTVRDPHDETRALAFLGLAHCRAGDTLRGTEELTRALETFTGAGSTHWQGRTLEMLGLAAEAQDDPGTAAEHYQRARALWQPISSRDANRMRERLRTLHTRERGTATGAIGTDTGETVPAGTEAAGTVPAGTEAAGTEAAGVDLSGMDPAGAGAAGVDFPGADSTGADPTGADPTGADPTGTGPTTAGPAAAGASDAEEAGGPRTPETP
ncbi:tetratricopeptide repeat protein [Streptomyces albus subsp. chlorinus]|uniref:ATP-binding protein n=1 Tax=Streptomyces albus TaxID=1888 RepID=UPI00191D13CE|nr:tetratricopeptide repeat protein [Streptomyces albus]